MIRLEREATRCCGEDRGLGEADPKCAHDPRVTSILAGLTYPGRRHVLNINPPSPLNPPNMGTTQPRPPKRSIDTDVEEAWSVERGGSKDGG